MNLIGGPQGPELTLIRVDLYLWRAAPAHPGFSRFDVIGVIIIITRPKPAYGRQGLAGSWGQNTDKVSTFLVFLTSHFAPGTIMTMKIHLETLKNHGNQPKTMKKP